MFRRLACLCLLSAATLSASNIWVPYAEVRGRGGDYRQGGTLHGFAPLAQNDSSILFTQGRVGRMRKQTIAGGGLGYRHLMGCDNFWGIAGFVDWSQTARNRNYLQGTISGELIVRNCELRGNLYLPSRNFDTFGMTEETPIGLVVEGTQVGEAFAILQTRERAYAGYDVEIGYNRELGCCNRVRGYAAYYQYARDGKKDVYGPRIRLRYEHDNLCFCGTRLTVEGTYQHDWLRGSQGEGMIGFRIPFCKPKCCCLRPSFRRMNDLVERDLGMLLVLDKQQVDTRFEPLANLLFFDNVGGGPGTQENPTTLTDAINGTGPGDILFGLADTGQVPVGMNQIALLPGQQLYGFNDSDAVTIIIDGQPLTITNIGAPGPVQLVQSNAEPVVTANNNTTIFGVQLINGTTGIDITAVQNVLVQKVNVENPTDTGIVVQSSNNIVIDQSTLEMSSGLVGFSAVNSSNVAANFDSIDVTVENHGILWDGSSGSFDVTGATSIDGLLANSSGISAINNSTVNFMFDTISIEGTAANGSHGLHVENTSGSFVAGDTTILDIKWGIRTDGTGLTEWTFDSLNLGSDSQRLDVGISIEAATNFTVLGDTDIWVEDRFVAYPNGIGIYDGDFNGTFGHITMDLNNQGQATAFDIQNGSGTTTIETKDVVLNNTVWGIYADGGAMLTDLTFNDFTIATPCAFGFDWGSPGSCTAADVTITQPSANGILLTFPNPDDFYLFDNLTITDATQDAIDFNRSLGTFTVNELTKIDNPGNYGIYAHIQPSLIDINLNRLEIVYDNVGDDGVHLEDHTGNFTVSNGGHILHNVAGNQNGLFATDCTGNISIFGASSSDRFEITGAAKGAGGGLLGGVFVTSTGSGNLENLTLDYVNIHDIGGGSGPRYGVLANNIADEVAITNSIISDIDGANSATFTPAIEINNTIAANPPSGTLTVTIQNNEIFGASDFSTTESALDIYYGVADPTNQLVADISGNTFYQLQRGMLIGLYEDAGTNTPNTVEIHNNTIHDLGGTLLPDDNTAIWLQPLDATKSIFCITENTINAETNTPANQADYAIHFDTSPETADDFDAQLTIQNNMINPASTSSFVHDGIRLALLPAETTNTMTALLDNNTIDDVTDYAIDILTAGDTLTVTLTDNTAPADAYAETTFGTFNILFGDPNSPGSNGNDFTLYELNENGGIFNLGSTGVAADAEDAITNLGNTSSGGAPNVTVTGTVNLIDANTTNFPPPTPCP